MVTRRYIKDYELTQSLTEGGALKTRAVYTGGEYRYISGPRERRRGARLCAAAVLLGILTFIAALLPVSRATRLAYVVLPHAFAALPMLQAAACAYIPLKGGQPLIHSQADKLKNRFPAACAVWTALCAASVLALGATAAVTTEGMLAGDAVFGACSLVCALCGAAAFSKRRLFICEKAD